MSPSTVLFCAASTWALAPAEVKEHFQEEFEQGRRLAAELEAGKKAEAAA